MATTLIEKVLPSNLQFLNSKNEVYTLEVGNRTKSVFTYDPTSFSTQSVTFNFNTPSSKVVMGRRFVLRSTYTVTLDAGTEWGSAFAPRQWAGMSGVRAVELTLNGQKSTFNPSDLIHAFGRLNTTQEQRAKFMTGTPSQPDIGEIPDFLKYQTVAVTATGVPGTAVTVLSIPNNNSPFSDEAWGNEIPRASIGYYTTAGSVRTYTFYTPVMCSPLSWSSSQDGLGNVSKVNLRLDYEANQLIHTFCYNNTAAALNVAASGAATVALTSNQLLVEYSDPLVDVPPQLAFEHIELQTDIRDVATVTAGGTKLSQMSTTQFMDIVPHSVMVWSSKKVSSRVVGDANVFLGITNLNIRYNNIEYNFDESQLNLVWQMSSNNGVDIPWSRWRHGSNGQKAMEGTLICLQFGKDIPLPAGVLPGSPMKSSLAVKVDLKNSFSVDVDADLHTVLTFGSRYLISENMASIVVGLTPDEQRQLEGAPISESKSDDAHEVVGGGMLSGKKLKKFAAKIGSLAKSAYDNRNEIMDNVHKAQELYNSGASAIQQARGVSRSAPDAMGSGLVGGLLVGGRRY